MVKKKIAKKISKNNVCDTNGYCGHKIASIKFGAMAFILFLITVWPALMNLVQRIHWGWFLGATILFGLGFMKRGRCCENC